MIIFVYGDNSFSASVKVEEMRQRYLDKFDVSGMNLVEFNAEKIGLGDALQAIQSPPFISEKRMVILKDLLGKLKKKDDIEPWIEGLKKTPDSTIVILFDREAVEKIEKHGLYKTLQVHPDFYKYPFPVLSGSQLTSWVRGYVKKINLNIQDHLLQQTVGLVGNDLWQLSLELDKLAAHAGSKPITEQMISDLVRANFEDQIFAFIDAVASG
ncbi:MAG: DNA polymerase III subunit delta, partial [Patescibacteria group bacterium]